MSELKTARAFASALIVCFSILNLSSASGALILPGGGFVAPAEPDPVGGTLLAGGVAVPFASAGPNGFNGTLTASVYAGDLSNSLGGLTFTYLLHSNATSSTAMERLTLADFSGFATDVSYQVSAGSIVPSVVDRSFGAGSIIGWDFTGLPVGLGTIIPGGTTALLVVQTNSPGYDLTQSASIIDGKTVNVASIGPNINVITPEPASLSLIVLGAAMGLRRRKV